MLCTCSRHSVPPMCTELFYNSFLYPYLTNFMQLFCIFVQIPNTLIATLPLSLSVQFIIEKDLCRAFFQGSAFPPLWVFQFLLFVLSHLTSCCSPALFHVVLGALWNRLYSRSQWSWASNALTAGPTTSGLRSQYVTTSNRCTTPCMQHCKGTCWNALCLQCCALVIIVKERTGHSYLSAGDRWFVPYAR